MPEVTWRDVLAEARAKLPGDEAWFVAEEASGWDRAELVRRLDEVAPDRLVAYARSMVDRRAAGEPLQYVLGRWGFRGLDLLVDRRVLIPRPETEAVVDVVLAELRRLYSAAREQAAGPPFVVDLGTGSGAIALAVAAEVPDALVWATDVSDDTLAVARANLAGSGSAVGPRVRLAAGRWYGALPDALRGRVDLIVSNPPYVAEGEELPAEVADWEPRHALVAGTTGLEAIDEVVAGAPGWLTRPGALVVELAPHQAETAAEAARGAGLVDVEVRDDLAGRPRVLVARAIG